MYRSESPGRSVCDTPFHTGPDALDPGAVNLILEANGCLRTDGTSQVDFIITRALIADRQAKQAQVLQPRSVNGEGTLDIIASRLQSGESSPPSPCQVGTSPSGQSPRPGSTGGRFCSATARAGHPQAPCRSRLHPRRGHARCALRSSRATLPGRKKKSVSGMRQWYTSAPVAEACRGNPPSRVSATPSAYCVARSAGIPQGRQRGQEKVLSVQKG